MLHPIVQVKKENEMQAPHHVIRVKYNQHLSIQIQYNQHLIKLLWMDTCDMYSMLTHTVLGYNSGPEKKPTTHGHATP